jgi:hypothetical protein
MAENWPIIAAWLVLAYLGLSLSMAVYLAYREPRGIWFSIATIGTLQIIGFGPALVLADEFASRNWHLLLLPTSLGRDLLVWIYVGAVLLNLGLTSMLAMMLAGRPPARILSFQVRPTESSMNIKRTKQAWSEAKADAVVRR